MPRQKPGKTKGTNLPRKGKGAGPKAKPSPARSTPPAPAEESHTLLIFPSVLFLAGVFCLRHYAGHFAGVSYIAAAALTLLFSGWTPGDAEKKAQGAWGLFLFSWILACLAFLSFPNFDYVLGKITLPFQNAYWLWFLSVILALFSLRYLPRKESAADWGRWPSVLILLGLLTVTYFFRMVDPQTPGGYYWDDWAMEVMDPLNMVDFHQFTFIFPIGKREPFFSYFMAGIWWLMPKATMIFVQRLTCTLIDLIAVVLVYCLGREFKSRRAGLIGAALAAVSIPLTIKCIAGMRLVSLSMGVAFLLLAFFRVVRKPTLPRFLLWGLAVGFGTYTYTGFRIWIFFTAFSLLAWLAWDRKETLPPFRVKAATALASLLAFFFFLLAGGYLSLDSGALKFEFIPKVIFLLGGLLLATLLLPGQDTPKEKEWAQWKSWAWGVLVGLALAYPILIQKEIVARLKVLTIFRDPNYAQFSLNTLHHWVEKIADALRTSYFTWDGPVERHDLGITGNAMFDFTTLVLFTAGLVFILAKPTRRLLFPLACVLVGMSPYLLSDDPHSGKLVGSVVPALLVGALGLEFFLEVTGTLFQKRGLLLATLGTVLFLAFGGRANFKECFPRLLEPQYPNVLISNQARLDSKNCQVFLHNYVGVNPTEPGQTVLQESNHVRLIQPSNPIFLRPGEKGKDLSVLIPLADNAMVERLKKEFPSSTWTDLNAVWQEFPTPFFHRGVIPLEALAEKPGKLFYIQRTGPGAWIRDFYGFHAGIGRGVIAVEDNAPLSATIPPGLGGDVSARFTGIFHAETGGKYKFAVSSPNYVILSVEGKELLDMRPRPVGIILSQNRYLELEKGDHPVEILMFYQNGREAPPFNVTAPNGILQTLGAP